VQQTNKVSDVFSEWTREKAIEEYEALVSALQYTIGERERLKALWRLVEQNLEKAGESVMARLMQALTTSPSERHQDIFAQLLTQKFTKGFFVEFGACDGVAASNTFVLEKNFGWNGILAEPGRVWHKSLAENRTARIDKRCVTAFTGDNIEFNEGIDPKVSSTDSSHKYLRQIKNTYTVETVSLMDLLIDHGAPRHIDFLSIDIEGGELVALENFDFSKYEFGFICIEQHDHLNTERDVVDILHNAGYKEIFPRSPDRTKPPHMQVTGIDLFFLPSDSPYFR
jgi:FkbM family methyltransferase